MKPSSRLHRRNSKPPNGNSSDFTDIRPSLDSLRRQSLDQGHNNRLLSSELIKSTVWMCRHVWNLLSSSLRGLEWLLMHSPSSIHSALYQAADSSCRFFFFFPGRHSALLRLKKDSTLYLCTHNVTLHCLFIRTHSKHTRRQHETRVKDGWDQGKTFVSWWLLQNKHRRYGAGRERARKWKKAIRSGSWIGFDNVLMG